MVPIRTLPIVIDQPRRVSDRRAQRTRSILGRLAVSLGAARRRGRSDAEAAEIRRADRALALIEHQVCDCV